MQEVTLNDLTSSWAKIDANWIRPSPSAFLQIYSNGKRGKDTIHRTSPSPHVERQAAESDDLDLRGLDDILQGGGKHANSSSLDRSRREREVIILDDDDGDNESGGGAGSGMTRVTKPEFMLSSEDDFMMADILDQTMRDEGTLIIGSIPPPSRNQNSSTRDGGSRREAYITAQELPVMDSLPPSSTTLEREIPVDRLSAPRAVELNPSAESLIKDISSTQMIRDTNLLSSPSNPTPELRRESITSDPINIPRPTSSTSHPTPRGRSESQVPSPTPAQPTNDPAISIPLPTNSLPNRTWRTLSLSAAKSAYFKRLNFRVPRQQAVLGANRAIASKPAALPKVVDQRPKEAPVVVREGNDEMRNGGVDVDRGEVTTLETAGHRGQESENVHSMGVEETTTDFTVPSEQQGQVSSSLESQTQIIRSPPSSPPTRLNDNTISSQKDPTLSDLPPQLHLSHALSSAKELSSAAEGPKSSIDKNEAMQQDPKTVSTRDEDTLPAKSMETTIPMDGVETVVDDSALVRESEMNVETTSQDPESAKQKEAVISDIPTAADVAGVDRFEDVEESTNGGVEHQMMQVDYTSWDTTNLPADTITAAEQTLQTNDTTSSEQIQNIEHATSEPTRPLPIDLPQATNVAKGAAEKNPSQRSSSSPVAQQSSTTYWNAPIPDAPLPSPRFPFAVIDFESPPVEKTEKRRQSATPFPIAPIPRPPSPRIPPATVDEGPIPISIVSADDPSASPLPSAPIDIPSPIPSDPTLLDKEVSPIFSPVILDAQTQTTPRTLPARPGSPAHIPEEPLPSPPLRKRSISVVTPAAQTSCQTHTPTLATDSGLPSPSRPMKFKVKFNETTPKPSKRHRISRSNSQSVQPPGSPLLPEPEMLDCIAVRTDFENVPVPTSLLGCQDVTVGSG